MRRSQEHGLPQITPIFAKKRQRLALLAHPNNTNSSSQSVGLGGGLHSRQSLSGPQSWRNVWNRPELEPPNAAPGPTNPISPWGAPPSSAPLQPWGSSAQPPQPFPASHPPPLVNTQGFHQGFSGSQPMHFTQGPNNMGGNYGLGPGPAGHNIISQPGNSFGYSGPPLPGAPYGQPAWGQPCLPPSSTHPPHGGATQPSGMGPSHWASSTYNTGPLSFSQGVPAHLPQTPYPGGQKNTQQTTGFTPINNQNRSTGTSTSTKPSQSFKIEAKRSPLPGDNSLHFLAASIEGMLHWSLYRTKKVMMFEVVAQLNSAVTSDHQMVSREFVLRDGKKSIQAVFYEIDRPLPRLVRGQWYRCIGSVEPRSGRFRCVSIRRTSEEERSLHQALIKAADKQMRGVVAKLSET